MARMGNTYHVSESGPVPILVVRVSSTFTFGESGHWAVGSAYNTDGESRRYLHKVRVGSAYTIGESGQYLYRW
jgi:hypothetical protein